MSFCQEEHIGNIYFYAFFFFQRWTSGNSNISQLVMLVLFHWSTAVELDRREQCCVYIFIHKGSEHTNAVTVGSFISVSNQAPTPGYFLLLSKQNHNIPAKDENEYLNRNHAIHVHCVERIWLHRYLWRNCKQRVFPSDDVILYVHSTVQCTLPHVTLMTDRKSSSPTLNIEWGTRANNRCLLSSEGGIHVNHTLHTSFIHSLLITVHL